MSGNSSLNKAIDAACVLMPQCGITRITDITRLDKIGVPVFSAIRPKSKILAVHSGKGLTIEQAKVSALMEAIEHAHAEIIPPFPDEFASSRLIRNTYGIDVLDYCPLAGREISVDEPMAWGKCYGVAGSPDFLAPFEVLFMPCPLPYGLSFLGSNTIGLSCGMSDDFAIAHGLCEVIERHIASMDAIKPFCRPIKRSLCCSRVQGLMDKLDLAGIKYLLRGIFYLGVHYVETAIWSPEEHSLYLLSGGISAHSSFDLAAEGALLEAIQTRATYIHGGRDDILDRYQAVGSTSWECRELILKKAIDRFHNGRPLTSIELPTSLEHSIERIAGNLFENGFNRVGYYRYSKPEQPVSVIRVVVPQMEQFWSDSPKIGRKLLARMRDNQRGDK